MNWKWPWNYEHKNEEPDGFKIANMVAITMNDLFQNPQNPPLAILAILLINKDCKSGCPHYEWGGSKTSLPPTVWSHTETIYIFNWDHLYFNIIASLQLLNPRLPHPTLSSDPHQHHHRFCLIFKYKKAIIDVSMFTAPMFQCCSFSFPTFCCLQQQSTCYCLPSKKEENPNKDFMRSASWKRMIKKWTQIKFSNKDLTQWNLIIIIMCNNLPFFAVSTGPGKPRGKLAS